MDEQHRWTITGFLYPHHPTGAEPDTSLHWLHADRLPESLLRLSEAFDVPHPPGLAQFTTADVRPSGRGRRRVDREPIGYATGMETNENRIDMAREGPAPGPDGETVTEYRGAGIMWTAVALIVALALFVVVAT